MSERIWPNVVMHKSVVCQENRKGTKINVGVLHSTEGGTLQSVLDYFDRSSTQASSNIIVGPGQSAVCMPLMREAWGVAGGWNPHCWHIEQLGYAHWNTHQWFQHQATMEETARWIALLYFRLGAVQGKPIPIRRARCTSFPRPVTWLSGWTEHRWLRDHDDPGTGYPFNWVLSRAKHYKSLMSGKHYPALPGL